MANAKKAPAQESAFKTMVYPVIILVVICVVCSALLAVLNDITAPIIAANEAAKTQEAYLGVLPEGTDTAGLTTLEGLATEGVVGAVTTPDGAVAVQASAAGYSGKQVTVFVSFDAAGTISKLSVDASTQTTGIGSKTGEESFYSGFLGWDAANHVSAGEPVDTIAGATVSSNAVITALNSAIDCYNNEIKGVA